MIEVLEADSWVWMVLSPPKIMSHIITDYPYGTEFHLDWCKRTCQGNIITFCASEDEHFIPSERA